MAVCEVFHLGMIPFGTARQMQEKLAEEVAAGARPEALLLLEHPPTFSFGRRARPEHLLWDAAECARRGVEVVWTDRGGDVTFHGPGQLVGYPILSLGRPQASQPIPRADYVGYVRRIEACLIGCLARLGLASGQVRGRTGVWIQPEIASRCPACPPAARKLPSKVASIGVKIDSRGITRHGFSLNVDPVMSYWEGIVACGLPDSPAIALADVLQPAPELAAVADSLIESFGSVFGFQMIDGQMPPAP
jgi:lipoyl(octanoyl) transferase